MKKIANFTLERQNKIHFKEFQDAFREIQERGIYILGPKVAEFEEKFASYLGVRYAVGVASGTDALSLSLLALGIKTGDEVILPANSYPTVFALTAIGVKPVLVDIDPRTFNIDPSKIEKAISNKTKAVIAVHMYGQPAELNAIIPVANKHKLFLIEDCAQAHGAEIKTFSGWQKVGGIGDAGCYSFYPTKNLGSFGDGGMVVTNNPQIYHKLKLLRQYGEEVRYKSILLGRNSRLDELQAAILLIKLKYLNKWNKRRREIAAKYNLLIKNLTLPLESKLNKHIYHLYVVQSQKREELKRFLEEKGIQTAVHYPAPIHLEPSMAFLGYKKGDFPESEKASQQVLSLPMFPELTNNEIEYITKALNKFS